MLIGRSWLCAAAIVPALLATEPDVSGRWSGTLMAVNGTAPIYFVFEQHGRKLAGYGGDAPGLRIPILDGGTIEGDSLRFQLRTEDGHMAYFSLHVHGDTIQGEEKRRGDEKNAKYLEKDGFKHVRIMLRRTHGNPEQR
jgi:hypothetical protein